MLMHPATALLRNGSSIQSRAVLDLPGVRQAVAGYDPSPLPALSDPDKADPVVRPGDLADPPDADAPPTTDGAATMTPEQAQAWVAYGERCFKSAQARKGYRAYEFYESRAAFLGDVWHRWDSRGGRFKDSRVPGWDKPGSGRRYEHRNFIVGKVLENIARVTRNSPDIGITPLTPAPMDLAGAHEARSVWKHFRADWKLPDLLRSVVQEHDISGPPLLKLHFDPSAEDDLPRMQPDGSVGGVFQARCGKVKCEIVRWEHWYTDHNGDFEDAAGEPLVPWIIHARPVRLADLQGYYANAWGVEAEAGVFGDTCIPALLAAAAGDYRPGSAQDTPQWVNLKEQYIAPTPKLKEQGYPDGLVLTWANRVLLDARNMEDGFPFTPVYHLKVEGDIDGLNYVGRILPAQRGYDRMLSKAAEHADLPPYHVLAMNQTSFSPNAYKGTESKIVNYTGGPPPVYQVKPPLPGEIAELLGLERANIDATSSVTPGDQLGADDASAAAIQLRMQADLSQAKDQISNVFRAVLWAAERALKLAGKYYTGPRLWLLSDGGDGPAASAGSLKALTNGARVRLSLSPDSATPRTPAMQLQFVQQVMTGDNLTLERLPAVIALLKAVDLYGTDDLAEELEKSLQQMLAQQQAAQPDAAQVQQMQQQHEAQTLAIQQQIDTQHNQAKLQFRLAEIAAETQAEIQKMRAERVLPPTVSLSGSLDPTGVVSAEKEAGLEGKVPPMPAPAAGGAKTKGKA